MLTNAMTAHVAGKVEPLNCCIKMSGLKLWQYRINYYKMLCMWL